MPVSELETTSKEMVDTVSNIQGEGQQGLQPKTRLHSARHQRFMIEVMVVKDVQFRLYESFV